MLWLIAIVWRTYYSTYFSLTFDYVGTSLPFVYNLAFVIRESIEWHKSILIFLLIFSLWGCLLKTRKKSTKYYNKFYLKFVLRVFFGARKYENITLVIKHKIWCICCAFFIHKIARTAQIKFCLRIEFMSQVIPLKKFLPGGL